MRKFESSHRRIEVLQTSRPQAVFLNHQLIILLSNLGIPDDVFMKLQRGMLDRLAGENVNNRSVSIDVAMCEVRKFWETGSSTAGRGRNLNHHEAYLVSFVF